MPEESPDSIGRLYWQNPTPGASFFAPLMITYGGVFCAEGRHGDQRALHVARAHIGPGNSFTEAEPPSSPPMVPAERSGDNGSRRPWFTHCARGNFFMKSCKKAK